MSSLVEKYSSSLVSRIYAEAPQDKYNTIQKLLKKTVIQFDSDQMDVTQNVVTRFYHAGKVIARPKHVSIAFIGGGRGEAGGGGGPSASHFFYGLSNELLYSAGLKNYIYNSRQRFH